MFTAKWLPALLHQGQEGRFVSGTCLSFPLAACREAELSTFTGWIRIHASAAAAAVSSLLQHWQRGGRVAPEQADSSSSRQQQSLGAPADKAAHGRGHSSTGFAAAAGVQHDVHAQ